MLTAYSLGYEARKVGLKKERNPFPPVGEWHKEWNRGWEHSDLDIQAAEAAAFRKAHPRLLPTARPT